jgi:hypothetical protein
VSSTRTEGPGPRSGLVGSQVAYVAVGSFHVVETDPVGDGDVRSGESVELFAVEALVTEAGVKGFDETAQPGRAGDYVALTDAAVGQAIADGAAINSGPLSERICSGAP